MLIKLNYKFLHYKKGSIIDLEKVNPKERTYFTRRLVDAKIDNGVEIVNNKKEESKKTVKDIKKDNKLDYKNDIINNETLN